MTNSLHARLQRVLLVLLAGLVLQWFIADRFITHATEREIVTRLQHDADSILATLELDASGIPHPAPHVPGGVYGQPGSGHYFSIRFGERLTGSASFGESPVIEPRAGQGLLEHVQGPRGQPLLVLHTATQFAGQPLGLAVGEDLTALRRELRASRQLFAVISLLLLAAALLLQRRELRLALRPLDAVRDAVLRLPETGKPPATLDAPAEIRPLVDEIARLMAFVEQRLQQSRTSVGNLSHALKTPLAAIVRLGEDPRLQALPDLREHLGAQARAIGERIERELRRARLAGNAPTRSVFVAGAELPALVELLRRIHSGRPLAIDWSAPDEPLAIDREDLLELLGTLADNACKWAASRVHIGLRPEGRRLLVVVADDGPGVAGERLDELGTRGRREDESMAGHGLGLAIVRDLVDFAGGDLALGRSATLGGFEVRVHLPLRSARP